MKALAKLICRCGARPRGVAYLFFASFLVGCLAPSVVAAALNCQDDIDGANDQPGQKDVTQFCAEFGDGAHECG